MSQRYQLWDGISNVYTGSGEVFTPEEWLNRRPAYRDPKMIMVLSGGPFNGSLIDELNNMKMAAKMRGAVFADGLSNQELLDAIEQFENDFVAAQQAAAEVAAQAEADYAAASLKAEQDVAGALTYQNMMNY